MKRFRIRPLTPALTGSPRRTIRSNGALSPHRGERRQALIIAAMAALLAGPAAAEALTGAQR